MNMRGIVWASVCAFLVLPFAGLRAERAANDPTSSAQPADFYPVAVWYGGGKARAPMLEPVDASSVQRWGKVWTRLRRWDSTP